MSHKGIPMRTLPPSFFLLPLPSSSLLLYSLQMTLLTAASLFAVFAAILVQQFSTRLLPYGPAADIPLGRGPHLGPSADPSNESLRLSSKKLTKIYERVEEGKHPLVIKPETIILNDDGQIFVLSENGKLVTLVDVQETEEPFISTAKAIEVAYLGIGRPLSGKFHQDGCLYFVDVILGLARICLNNNEDDTRMI